MAILEVAQPWCSFHTICEGTLEELKVAADSLAKFQSELNPKIDKGTVSPVEARCLYFLWVGGWSVRVADNPKPLSADLLYMAKEQNCRSYGCED